MGGQGPGDGIRRWLGLPAAALVALLWSAAAGPAGTVAAATRTASAHSVAAAGTDATTMTGTTMAAPTTPATPAQVTIHAGQTLASLTGTSVGINNAVWDGSLLEPDLPGLLRKAGVRVMRYPGGSTSDVYHWQTNTTEPGQSYANPSNTFDAFMGVVQRAGAQAMITANYGSGTPEEAAAWVRYANVTHHYGVKYWEIGNEIYGNGTYGADWEYDLHSQKGPAAYAQNAVQFIDAMKAVDPTIKVGVVLTAPGNWPDGVVRPGDTMDWNHTVLSIAGGSLDFAIVHWYPQNPGNESDQGLLAAPSQIEGMVAALRAEIAQYSGPRAASVQIMATETNSVSYNPGKQTVGLVNALFLADNYLSWLEQGVASVEWWDTHNGITTGNNDSSSLYGDAAYGDYGVLANGSCAGSVCEPGAGTPFPPYYGLRLLTRLAAPGSRLVPASADHPLISVHAARTPTGELALLLVNKDPATAYRVSLSYEGFQPQPGATVSFYGEGSSSIREQRENGLAATREQVLPPYSLTVVVVGP